MRPSSTTAVLVLIAASIASLTGCGGGGDDDAGASPADAAEATSDAAADSVSSTAAGAAAVDTPAGGTGVATGAQGTECPDDTVISGAYGGEVDLDENGSTTGAVGIIYCQYTEVLAPGTTDPAFGGEAYPDTFSITYTVYDTAVGDNGQEAVDGAGERAFWGGTELVVWTGERGIIVSMQDPPNDPKVTAIALAQAADQ